MNKIIDLVIQKIPYDVFSHAALINLIPGSKDRRYAMIKRAIASKEIIHLRKGLYCLAPKYRRYPLDLFEIAQKIYGPSYISLESSLAYHGWIPEAVHTVTSVCVCRSKDFKTPVGNFSYRRVPLKIFYEDVEAMGSAQRGIFLMARPLKALADYVYLYRKEWEGLTSAMNSLRIDIESFQSVPKKEFRELKKIYPSKRVCRFLGSIEKELGGER
ncbi:MAG TPA: hypothetical protein PKO44_06400 [Candidatus Omnitrophota bacterium]|nr:hypothetical protein [Candidatus Omnitrophota bacterium]